MLGAVGAYEWNGTVVMHTDQGTMVPINADFQDPRDERKESLAGYVGYDVQSASTPNGVLYITGAPRYNHTGRVIVYKLDGKHITVTQVLKGEQIGSYFGSVLQTVDVDQDSYTDILLVGAPMYMGPEKEEQGQVYVYKLNEKGMFEHQTTLKPDNQICCTSAHSHGCTNVSKNDPCGARFGTAIAEVSDLDLDGNRDVAIGAPFENDHRGAVYIYHGAKKTIKEKYVQRIPGPGDGVKTKFFGQSIHGVMDLNGDGIIDVTIGGLGGASLFWETVCVKTRVCFSYSVKSEKDDTILGTDEKSERKVQATAKIIDSLCVEHLFAMKASKSFLTQPEFGLAEDTGPVLDGDLPTLVIKANKEKFHVLITTRNSKDNAYNTKVMLSFIENINYVKVEVRLLSVFIPVVWLHINFYYLEHQNVIISVSMCFDIDISPFTPQPKEKDCSLNNTKVECAEVFKILFEVNPAYVWKEIQINVTATSDSEEVNATLHDNTVRISIPVKYEPGLRFTADRHMKEDHIIVKEGEQYPSVFNHTSVIGEVVKISYTLRVTYPYLSPRENVLLYLTDVTSSQINHNNVHTLNLKKETLSDFLVGCKDHPCKSFDCSIPHTNNSQVNVTFRVWKPTFIKAEFTSLHMIVHATLENQNTDLFMLSTANNARDVKIQVSKEALGGIPLWIIIVSILIGLLILALVIFALWKAGFFKRKSMEDMEKEDIKN
ncbi:unnamed protein product [Coregonus sp. 'balchen']|nr:unnamed protein product [Coregonus sp. 'balchen']